MSYSLYVCRKSSGNKWHITYGIYPVCSKNINLDNCQFSLHNEEYVKDHIDIYCKNCLAVIEDFSKVSIEAYKKEKYGK